MAVNPPPQVRHELTTRLDAPRRELRLAWTRPEAWHLTLMFLGSWPQERVRALVLRLQAAVAPRTAFGVTPGALGVFPGPRRPRVLFLHLDGGDALRSLAQDVRLAVDQAWPDGPQDRKEWRPHLTLARIKRPLPAVELARLRDLDLGVLPAFPVDAAWLLASDLRPEGARHTVVAELPFAGCRPPGEH